MRETACCGLVGVSIVARRRLCSALQLPSSYLSPPPSSTPPPCTQLYESGRADAEAAKQGAQPAVDDAATTALVVGFAQQMRARVAPS